MERVERDFLKLICNHIRNENKVNEIEMISYSELEILYEMSINQSIFPMFYESILNTKHFANLPEDVAVKWRRQTIMAVASQAARSECFLNIYKKIYDAGFKCAVVKGIICRQMYPMPDYRFSSDEDIYISKDDFMACHKLLIENGLKPVGVKDMDNIENEHVVSYMNISTGVHIELHQTLFEENLNVFGYLNDFFIDVLDNIIEIDVKGTKIKTFSYTDNLLYLICHALKHFVMRGFGIRQLCDIILFAENYGTYIDWTYMEEVSKKVGGYVFSANIFDIGEKYFGFSREKACMKQSFLKVKPDSYDLLKDLLDAGLYGKSSESRIHSNSVTLDAMANRTGKNNYNKSILKAVFPELSLMKERYSILNKAPYLLPFMWLKRIVTYFIQARKSKEDNLVSQTLNVGRNRLELLKKYGILK